MATAPENVDTRQAAQMLKTTVYHVRRLLATGELVDAHPLARSTPPQKHEFWITRASVLDVQAKYSQKGNSQKAPMVTPPEPPAAIAVMPTPRSIATVIEQRFDALDQRLQSIDGQLAALVRAWT